MKNLPRFFDSFPNPARFIARRDRREQRELLNSTYKRRKIPYQQEQIRFIDNSYAKRDPLRETTPQLTKERV